MQSLGEHFYLKRIIEHCRFVARRFALLFSEQRRAWPGKLLLGRLWLVGLAGRDLDEVGIAQLFGSGLKRFAEHLQRR
jgi:hypothetical protein